MKALNVSRAGRSDDDMKNYQESKVLVEVRRIKEQIAREAEGDPGYYQRLNGLGAKLMAKCRASKRKATRR
jgi:hypothetical protein